MYVILVYDCGERRVAKMLKLCRNYLNWIQNSVFEADLDYSSFLKLKDSLLKLINPEEDSLRFYYLGNNWNKKIEHIGAEKTYDPEGVIII